MRFDVSQNMKEKLIELVKDQNIQDIFCDFAEVVIDSVSDSKLIEEIPIVGTLTKGGRAALSFRDRLFVQKIGVFLRQLNKTSAKDRDQFIAKLETKKRIDDLAEELLARLDRIETKEKARILAELFKDYVFEKIERDNFLLFCIVVEKVSLMDLHMLRYVHEHINKVESHVGSIFVPLRIFESKFELVRYNPDNPFWTGPKEDRIIQKYKITPWGRQFIQLLERLYG